MARLENSNHVKMTDQNTDQQRSEFGQARKTQREKLQEFIEKSGRKPRGM